jgi:hypothetical protein
MTLQPNPEFADQEARNRISKLEEHILRQNNRIAFLETSILQHLRTAPELDCLKREIASLNTTITELKAENSAQLKFIPRFTSIESDISELKTSLIENSILAERKLFLKDDPLDGIIASLTRNCGGNVSDCGIVEIKSKSFYDDGCLPKNASNFTPGSPNVQSKCEMNQWIEWDFKTSQIKPTHYSIRTHRSGAGGGHLQHWVIEGRNDEEEEWIQLDERRDNSELNGKNRIATFEIANRVRIRILRLRQIGLNHRSNLTLAFHSFEVFGEMFKIKNRNLRLVCFRSIKRDLSELQAILIEKEVLPERFALKDDQFDGIIASLTRDCGGNVSDRGIVEITASSFIRGNLAPKNAADFAWSSPNFNSKN